MTALSSAVACTPIAARPVLDASFVCPECGEPFAPRQARTVFCCPEHKRAWHNRATVRGVTLVPLVIADRETRGGTRGDKETGKRARCEAQRLMARWRDEDRAAGRLSQVEYLRRRYAAGYGS